MTLPSPNQPRYDRPKSARGALAQPTRAHLINHEIQDSRLRLVDADGSALGITDRATALQMANDRGCDLVLLVPNAQPPVCRLVDYGKFVYEEQKRQKEADKKQRAARIEIKEFQFRPNIDSHDLGIKIKKMQEFLDDGDKCKVVVRFRGRENADPNKGAAIVDRIMGMLQNAQQENRPELNGNKLVFMISAATKKPIS